MLFDDINAMTSSGFSGFVTVDDLMRSHCEQVPAQAGVYFVLYLSDGEPRLLTKSVGGFFKGKDPTVDLEELKDVWVPGAKVIHIGKAGGGARRHSVPG